MKAKDLAALLVSFLLLFSYGCFSSVKKDFAASPEYRPRNFQRVAVISTDPQIHFSEYVEAELVRRGYLVRESASVRELLAKEGVGKDGVLDPATLAKIGSLLDVQGIVLCNVLDFSRFRDAYRLNIKLIDPQTGNTMWSAQGAMEGKKGQKKGELLKNIVTLSLKDLPRVR